MAHNLKLNGTVKMAVRNRVNSETGTESFTYRTADGETLPPVDAATFALIRDHGTFGGSTGDAVKFTEKNETANDPASTKDVPLPRIETGRKFLSASVRIEDVNYTLRLVPTDDDDRFNWSFAGRRSTGDGTRGASKREVLTVKDAAASLFGGNLPVK